MCNGRKKTLQQRVHRLVAEAFIPNPEDKRCVNHKDGNRVNNSIDNLEWCTHSENTINGMQRGSIQKPSKKIDFDQVQSIRKMYNQNKLTQKQIGNLFGISQTQICRIINNKNWK